MSYHELVQLQRDYFKSGATRSYEFRKRQLLKLRELLVRESKTISAAIHADLKRSAKLTEIIEVQAAITEIDYVLDNLHEWMRPEYVEKTLKELLDTPMIVREPFGVIFLITTWNFPAIMFFYPIIAMLAAGNTIVIKASEVSAKTSSLIAEHLNRTFDKRLLHVVEGTAEVTTELLKEQFDKIMYTGSTGIAKIIMKAAAESITPLVLELGGKCPVIVESDADLEITAKRLVWGKCFNAGQTCVAPDFIITSPEVKSKLVGLIQKTTEKFYGPRMQTSPDYNRIINERHFDRLSSLIDQTQGQVVFRAGESDRSDLFIPLTLVDCQLDDPLMKDELFGPILPIITVPQPTSDGIKIINAGHNPLAAYIFTKNNHKIQRLIDETQSGGVVSNDTMMHYGVDTLPFGGIGNSGFGQYRGKYGYLEFSHPKAVLLRGFFGDSMASARYPPMTGKSYRDLAYLLKRRSFPRWLSRLRPSIPSLLIGLVIGIVLQRSGRLAALKFGN
ncbi:Aldehyde dehydrogenase [Aphelenchoides besseyi]|nr:Aldehyde dehydrogenase [Aphelenchoides besseyi]